MPHIHQFKDYVEEMTFEHAIRIIKSYMGTDDLLAALKSFESRYVECVNGDEDAFYAYQRDYRFEISAFNVLCEGFGKLFAPKEKV